MSTLSELFPAGGGDNSIDMVATGTLPNGSPVILKADGTVEVVAESSTSVAESIPAGSEAVFRDTTNTIRVRGVAFDPSTPDSIVIVYTESSVDSGEAVSGTVSGTSITFGTPVVYNSGPTSNIAVAFDPNTAGKFLIIFKDNNNSNYGTAIVGAVSGSSLSFGAKSVFASVFMSDGAVSFAPNTAGKLAISYRNNNTDKGEAVVGTVSGTSVTFGSIYEFNASAVDKTKIKFDLNDDNKIVIVYVDVSYSNVGVVNIGTISGTTISFNSKQTYNSGSTTYPNISFDPNTSNKVVIAYRDNGNLGYGTAIVGTISGTSMSFGSEYVFNSAAAEHNIILFNPVVSDTFSIIYNDSGNSEAGTVITGTITGTSVSFGSKSVYNTGGTHYISASIDPNTTGKFIVGYTDYGSSQEGVVIVCQMGVTVTTTNLTSTNLLGISQKAVANGETTSVETLGGLSAVHSGLTIGSDYYVAGDGSLTTTSTDNVSIGRAVAATTINMRNYV